MEEFAKRFGNTKVRRRRSCNELKALDFDPETKINDNLDRAISTGYLPISFENPLKKPKTLKTENKELYDIIKS